MVNLTTYDEGFIDPNELFIKINKVELNLERVMYDNCKCNMVSRLTGQELRRLLDGIREDIETDNEYLIRQEVFDGFEEENVVNEWMVKC